MSDIFITGGGGFIGYRLAQALLQRGALQGANGTASPIGQITLFDAAFPPHTDPRLNCVTGNIAEPGAVARAMRPDTGVVFHLAAVVSSAAEADFELGMRVNLAGTLAVLDASRALHQVPRVVYASSGAVFGGEMPASVDDDFTPLPETSYGTQKLIGEHLLTDYTRKGFIDGRALRLPTVMVRPGKPNAAASSFWSGIVREPLNGVRAVCPVAAETTGWLLSARKVVEAFIHAAELPSEAWGVRRAINLPGSAVSVNQILAALRAVAGPAVASRVDFVPDARIEAIVRTWAPRYDAARALGMGFTADAEMESVIRDYIASENIDLEKTGAAD
ncbi:MAG: NAD-dependent epimerase [Rhodoferax sp.]|nr:NAD-dependent epimerase [Rhodoferax sp.]